MAGASASQTYGASAPQTYGAADSARTAVQRSLGSDYLQRAGECGTSDPDRKPGTDGGCSGCGLSRPVQTKLSVGPAGDAYEQEADRVAERVVGMSGPAGVSDPAGDGPRIDIQRLATGPAAPTSPVGPAGGSCDAPLPTGGGRPLSAATRAFMEPRFGQDFGDVRVHSGPDTHQLAARIQARAFTHDNHVHLGGGESEHNHRLIAHELTHVVQQRGGATAASGTGATATVAPPSRGTVQRAISPELAQIEDYLSYGIFDWAITDAEAVRALTLLKSLSRFQQAAFFTEATYAGRLRGNLPDDRVAELDALAADAAGLQPPAATVEAIEDRLSYGLFDWVVTDRDAVEALEMLKQLSGGQLATALAAINYGRLMDNLPDARKPELTELYDRGLGLGGARETEEQEHPGTLIRSISFKSDHGMMKDNTEDWGNSGRLYGEPEWFADKGKVVSHPVSQTRNTAVRVDLGLNVLPADAPPAPVRLTGRSSEPALNFDFTGSMRGGLNQSLPMTSAAALPDTITALENRQIVWNLEWRDWKHEVGRTRHSLYVTAATPLAPGEVTDKRMRAAVSMVGSVARQIGSLDPHPLVSGIMSNWGVYNLDVVLPNAWELADNISRGAQCIDIVRFVQALLQTVGAPGVTAAVVVWAKPDSPLVPEESMFPHGGLHTVGAHPAHPTWFPGLMDANGCPNAFEAALRFDHGGLRRYYPGGVDMARVYSTPLDVLRVFQCFAWLSPISHRHFNIQVIAATYPDGTCSTGEVTCG
ncbi:DUF4157 domain-containing protein [Streptomyces sp. H27-D2]|nr:DUF4157 domain-containing protein [Streptomyces sp. H27-D2]